MSAGLRNSHDKWCPVCIVARASVFVCDDLSISEVQLSRKHTVYIERDLPSSRVARHEISGGLFHDKCGRQIA